MRSLDWEELKNFLERNDCSGGGFVIPGNWGKVCLARYNSEREEGNMGRGKLGMLAAAALAVCLAACGGSGGSITPPPPAGNFSNASLNGQYAFSMSGVAAASGAYFAEVGSIAADGQGHITSGLADLLNLGSAVPVSIVTFSNGTYQIQTDGRGLITLNVTGGEILRLSVSLKSNTEGIVVETDGAASTSGSLNLQTPSQFSAGGIKGNYVFDFSGISFAGLNPSPISLVGQFAADGNENLTGGTVDVNDGSFGPTGAVALTANTYQMDASGNGTNFGRGTMTLDGRTYAFYIVDNTRAKFLEEDSLGGTEGEALLQTGTIPTQNSQFSGSVVFLTGGFVAVGNFGPNARLGRFTADGAGGISAISFDESNNGRYVHIAESSGISSAAYAMDTSNAGSGRGTFTFHNSSTGTVSYVFYLYTQNGVLRAVIQDVSAGIVGDGNLLTQAAGPFTTGSVAGNYTFHWSGVQLIAPSPFREDFVGQYAQTNAASGNMTGAADYDELGLNSVGTSAILNAGLAGTLTVTEDGTQNNAFKIAVGGTSPFTINFTAYFADNGTMLFLCSDSTRTTSGVGTQQTQ